MKASTPQITNQVRHITQHYFREAFGTDQSIHGMNLCYFSFTWPSTLFLSFLGFSLKNDALYRWARWDRWVGVLLNPDKRCWWERHLSKRGVVYHSPAVAITFSWSGGSLVSLMNTSCSWALVKPDRILSKSWHLVKWGLVYNSQWPQLFLVHLVE